MIRPLQNAATPLSQPPRHPRAPARDFTAGRRASSLAWLRPSGPATAPVLRERSSSRSSAIVWVDLPLLERAARQNVATMPAVDAHTRRSPPQICISLEQQWAQPSPGPACVWNLHSSYRLFGRCSSTSTLTYLSCNIDSIAAFSASSLLHRNLAPRTATLKPPCRVVHNSRSMQDDLRRNLNAA